MSRSGWSGATVVCIASGPSLHADDLALIAQAQATGLCKVACVNSSFTFAPFADLLYAGDMCWWKHYAQQVAKGKWQEFAGEKWTTSKAAAERFKLHHVNGWHGHGHGLSVLPGRINLGGNGGYATVGLAYDRGASRILLTGYDMQRTKNRTHCHGDHPQPLRNPPSSLFPVWVKRFSKLARGLEKAGVEVLNCTRESALQCFPRVSIEEALCIK